jgi:hypothetical protein
MMMMKLREIFEVFLQLTWYQKKLEKMNQV